MLHLQCAEFLGNEKTKKYRSRKTTGFEKQENGEAKAAPTIPVLYLV
jgi:hypothetical protein